jgi:hypothetical protein
MRPLVHTIEAQFHGAANAQVLRELHERGDWNDCWNMHCCWLSKKPASDRRLSGWLARRCVHAALSRGIWLRPKNCLLAATSLSLL